MKASPLVSMALVLVGLVQAGPAPKSSLPRPPLSMSPYEKEVFDAAMLFNDISWEPSTGWIEANDDSVGLLFSCQASDCHDTD